MKKFLALALLTLVVVSNAFAFRGGCAPCPRTCNTVVDTEPRPNCYKMVRAERPARKVCETTCHWVCPPDTIREESAECA